MNKKIIVATSNPGKVREYNKMLHHFGFEVLSLKDFPDFPEIDETGETFSANADLKAFGTFRHFNLPALGDDSGLEVFALGGRPGVYSARYGKAGSSDKDKCLQLLKEMDKISESEREARFVCHLTLVLSEQEVVRVWGECRGRIYHELKGENGFGFDPIFYLPERNCTMAQLDAEVKNSISHRGRALQQLKEELANLLKRSLA